MAEVDWDRAYVDGRTPWDLGGPLPLLVEALGGGLLGRPGVAVAPGAGRGHDAQALVDADWTTTVVDLSPAASAYATEHYPEVGYVVGDALDPALVRAATGPVDLLWDHTFFCALPPELRPAVGALARAVVRPGGLVASGVFPMDRDRGEEGPPWAYDAEDMDAALGDGFERIHTGEPVHLNAALPWRHRLAIWRRRERWTISSGSTFEEQIGYARAVVDGEWVHVSGTTGFDYATMTIPEGVVAQAEQALRNVEAALAQAGATFADVVRVRYLLPSRDDFEPCWPLLRAAFGAHPPAATMQVCGLADERMLIEIEVTARLTA